MSETTRLTREQLIVVVQRIMRCDGTEEEIDELVTTLERNVPHPAPTDLIFYPHDMIPGFDLEQELTAEEVVDLALGYQPILL
jgi:hypothetical protein